MEIYTSKVKWRFIENLQSIFLIENPRKMKDIYQPGKSSFNLPAE